MKIANDLNLYQSDINALKQQRQSIEQLFQGMYDEIMQLNAMWTGPSHDVFEKSFLADSLIVKNMIQFLTVYEQELETAIRSYGNCEEMVGGIIKSAGM